ncbi:MAG: glycosyltransferase family 39 protein, partial [Candidatus Omnitrophota bacterium]|nr:glycosyltransferase family 39 protein [Candidatus Omnitrophota bacterium]
MSKFPDWKKLIRANLFLLPALAMPVVIFAFTFSRYYGFYYDNHYFNLLALEMTDKFRLCFYLGSTYSIHSTVFSYLVYPFFYIFGPTDFSMEFVSALFHLGVIIVCFQIGKDFFSKAFGLVFAYLVAVAPIYLINVYTWNEYTLIAFLNILSVYYYLRAFREHSGQKMALSSFFYALSCLQAIYSMLLLLFFVSYALLNLINFRKDAANFNQGAPRSRAPVILRIIFYIGAVLAFLYLILLLRAMFVSSFAALYYAGISLLLLMGYFVFRKLPGILQEALRFHLLFFAIAAVILLLADLFVQLDVNFFGQQFGHYRDTYYAGGIGPFRAPFVFGGKALAIYGRPVYLSVLSSIFAFRTGYAKVALDFSESARIMVSYYRQCYDPAVNLFFLFGIFGLFFDIARRAYKRERLDTRQIFPLAWLIAATAAFVNVYPYHMLRIYILPMPYLLAALGINYIGDLSAYVYNRRRFAGTVALVALTLFLSLRQIDFCVKNIFRKFTADKAR